MESHKLWNNSEKSCDLVRMIAFRVMSETTTRINPETFSGISLLQLLRKELNMLQYCGYYLVHCAYLWENSAQLELFRSSDGIINLYVRLLISILGKYTRNFRPAQLHCTSRIFQSQGDLKKMWKPAFLPYYLAWPRFPSKRTSICVLSLVELKAKLYRSFLVDILCKWKAVSVLRPCIFYV